MKRFFYTVISSLVIASNMCCNVMAEDSMPSAQRAGLAEVYDVFVTGTARPGHILTAWYELSADSGSIVKWYRGEDEIFGENLDEYRLTKADAEQNIRVGVTPVMSDGTEGIEIFSRPLFIASSLTECTARNNTNIADYTENPLVKNNPDYVFSENGYTYIYLEAEENGMYVIADDIAGRVKLTEDPKDNYFNPENSSSIAYWLNHDYLEGRAGSGGKKINPHVTDYLEEREYLTEGNGVSNMNSKEDYVVKCKVAIPAFYEFTEQYSDIIGYNPTGTTYYMVFRTPISNNRTSCPNLKTDTGAVGVSVVTTTDKNYVNLSLRPCMLIGYDFFKEHKLDMNMGSEVKSFLRTKFTREEMLDAGYTEEELLQIGYVGSLVSADDFTMAGIRAAGQMLSIDNMRELPDNTDIKYSWYYSDKKDGQFKKIVSAGQKNYVIEDRLIGMYIKAQAEIYSAQTGEKYVTVDAVTDAITQPKPLTVIAEGYYNGTAAFTVTNNTGATTDICFIVSAFDKDNKMIGCTAQTEPIDIGESEISIILQENGAYVYRLMAWETAESAKLLCGRTIR